MLNNIELVKWPQMIVTGKSVSEDRAKEIIRRTDSFFEFPFGNNKNFVEKAKKVMHIPKEPIYSKYKKVDNYYKAVDRYEAKVDAWRKAWKFIQLEYIYNDWISCVSLDGPNGWMHPDGTIYFDRNIGKYPTIEEIFNDWNKVASAFTDLELEITIMSGSSFSDFPIKPVVGFLVRDGKVSIVDVDLIQKIREDQNREASPINRVLDENYFDLTQLENFYLMSKKS